MKLTMKQSNAVQALAQVVCDFLPGSGNPQWRSHVTFGTVAKLAGAEDFWTTSSGSKTRRLIHLFERTLEERRGCFEALIIGIVKEGLRYRSSKGRAVTAPEIVQINGHLLEVGFKFPELWEAGLLQSLSSDDQTRAEANVAATLHAESQRVSARAQFRTSLDGLRTEFEEMFADENRQRVGFMFESLLNRLFRLFELEPRDPFRVVGEQIDGSFLLDSQVYLLEAKWMKDPRPQADLLVFHGKIEGKAAFTRGVFIAVNGITRDAELSIRAGKRPSFFVVNGHDLMMVLQGAVSLDEFLRARVRALAEEGAVVKSFSELRRS